MKKIFLLHIIILCIAGTARADHITGGEIFYTLKSVSGNAYTYGITVKMYIDCASSRPFNDTTIVSFFTRPNNVRIKDVPVLLSDTALLELTDNDSCIDMPQTVCYRVGYYRFDVTLLGTAGGYTIAAEVFFRVFTLKNLIPGYHVGATYTAEIPGVSEIPAAPANNSAQFLLNDLVVICAGSSFTYSFAAIDKDGDSLRYSLCDAFQTGSTVILPDRTVVPPDLPPYPPLPYSPGYNGSTPLGGKVSINSNTGLVSGIAPDAGSYALAACVSEIRNGVVIATQRKDLQIKVTACSRASAILQPAYILCRDTKNIELSNESVSPLINSYYWSVLNQKGFSVYNSSDPVLSYTFPDTGLYTIRLNTNTANQCKDSTSALASVYPGFKPDFTADSTCVNAQTQFKDNTFSPYGIVNSWQWDFKAGIVPEEITVMQNPLFNYQTSGIKNVQLIAGDTKGCIDTIVKPIPIYDPPPLKLAFTDTLICFPDTLQLMAEGIGNFSWAPAINIAGANTASPTVKPQTNSTYYATLEKNGCISTQAVTVRVVDHVTLQVMKDSTICLTDTVQLHIISDALKYTWSPPESILINTIQNPLAVPFTQAVTYTVIAAIGSCTAQDSIRIATVPYPVSFAGNDTAICYGSVIQLNGITDGSSFSWYPGTALSSVNSLHPLAAPTGTTTYTLTAFDTKGCPKPGIDNIIVVVFPKIPVFAGRDTSVIINQPLQLNGSGGAGYSWSPAVGLSDVNIANPLANYSTTNEGIRYRLLANDNNGCTDSAFIIVKVYKALPSVFVPTGFSPNGDGRNDVLRPVAVGIERIELFNIYNRWGQLLFTTTVNGKGWDGTFNGTPQLAGTYVWIVKAVDYSGKPYFEKGTVTIVR